MFGFFNKKKEKKVVKKQAEKNEETPKLAPSQILDTINRMQKELDRLKLAITSGVVMNSYNEEESLATDIVNEIRNKENAIQKSENEKIIEGVFNGTCMIGADGLEYDVPANYASKSKLVEGDILKLTINNLGSFVYKQIKPIERLRKVGVIDQDAQNLQYYAVADGKKWKLLTASVTYFKGEPGDEVIFLIPAEGGSRSAAVENIIKK